MNIGDVVRLNSGGPEMTVYQTAISKGTGGEADRFEAGTKTVRVTWHDDTPLKRPCASWFPVVCLTSLRSAKPRTWTAIEVAAETYRSAHEKANAADARVSELQRLERLEQDVAAELWKLARDAKQALEQTARGYDNFQQAPAVTQTPQ